MNKLAGVYLKNYYFTTRFAYQLSLKLLVLFIGIPYIWFTNGSGYSYGVDLLQLIPFV